MCDLPIAGNYEKCVSSMMSNLKDDDKQSVVQNILSHAGVAKKNLIVVYLLVSGNLMNSSVGRFPVRGVTPIGGLACMCL